MAKTNIEWTEENYNPFYGCRRKSEGCVNCYAEQIAGRFSGIDKNGKVLPYSGIATKTQGVARWTGDIKLNEEILLAPLRNKKPTKYFVNSMSDTFYSEFPDEWIDKLFAVMALCPQHTFQILTKRAGRMRNYFVNDLSARAARIKSRILDITLNAKSVKTGQASWEFLPLKNVWLGVSVENQKTADERIPLLLDTPAAVRWLSCEPLLEEIKLEFIPGWCKATRLKETLPLSQKDIAITEAVEPFLIERNKIRWVVVGGESGSKARPCSIDWIRSIVGQCKGANVPVFVKQLGTKPFSKTASVEQSFWSLANKKGGDWNEFPADLKIREFPKAG